MNTQSRLEMHADHLRWIHDNDSWRGDIAVWQDELEQAIGQVDELARIMENHLESLRQHAAAIRAYDEQLRRHEHAVALSEKFEISAIHDRDESQHSDEAEHHGQQRDRHEALKRRQHELLAHFSAMLKSMSDCAQ